MTDTLRAVGAGKLIACNPMSNLFLQSDAELSIDGSNIVLRRRGVPVSHILGVAEGIALSFLAATGNFKAASEACEQCLPQGSFWLQRVSDRFWPYLGDGPARPVDAAWLAQLTRCRPAFPILPMSSVKYEPAPASITWMVTLGCNRRCPYCFFDVFHHPANRGESPKDATFPLEGAVRMVKEMAQIGAADLYLTGGEPLLRGDLPDLIREAARVRVRTHITSKYPIDRCLAGQLSDAGLTSITISLDDARPKHAAGLAGARDYLTEATVALRAILETGIELEVNAVATDFNQDGLSTLADYLAALGVPKLKISPFNDPFPSRPHTRSFTTPASLSETVALIAENHKNTLSIELDGTSPSATRSGLSCADHAVCEIGTRSLHIMPDGSVSRCRYLPGMPEMIVGSLQKSTLMEIWNGFALQSMTRPDREVFSGTSCFDCGSHDACNSRGRCHVSALQSHGRLHAPDTFCSRPSV